MLIKEIITRKKYLDGKLLDLENYIHILSDLVADNKTDLYNKAVEEKFGLLNKIQSHEVLIQEQNNLNKVIVGSNELTVYDAIKLRDTLHEKIKTLDYIVRFGDFKVINIFSLLDQRDVLFEDYLRLKNAIDKSDIIVEWKMES